VTAVMLLIVWRLRRGWTARGAAAAVVVLALAAWSSLPEAGPPAVLTVTFLDVGQGDAAVVRTPEGGTLLIDAGPEPDQVVVDLAALGVRRIDLAVATHAHADHVEGFPAVREDTWVTEEASSIIRDVSAAADPLPIGPRSLPRNASQVIVSSTLSEAALRSHIGL